MYKFKHYLNFKDLPDIGEIEILEPIGFDGSSHKVEQQGIFGRDVIKADENITFEFSRESFGHITTPVKNINGIQQTHLSHAFDWLREVITTFGWESDIEYILENRAGQRFVKGIVDVFTAQIYFDSMKFNIVQNTTRELVKRRSDVVVNAFSDKDLDGNTIQPCQTIDILAKGKPITESSLWVLPNTIVHFFDNVDSVAFNFSRLIKKYEIDNTLTFFDDVIPYNLDVPNDFKGVFAKNQMSNVEIVVKTNITFQYPGPNFGRVNFYVGAYAPPYDINSSLGGAKLLWNHDFIGGAETVTVPDDLSAFIDVVPAGYAICIFWVLFVDGAACNLKGTFTQCDISVKGASTAIDTIIKGTRLIDLMKHNVKSISGLPLIAPEYDVNGAHYDNFALNGYMIAQITDKPFNNTFEDLMNVPLEICNGHQINPDNVEILNYGDFYTNNDMGGFLQAPEANTEIGYSKEYFLKTLAFKYQKSSSERETNKENTVDDVHTETQRLFASKKTDGNKDIEIKHVRSAFLFEVQREKAIEAKDSVSQQYDDTLFILKCAPLPPGYVAGFSAVVAHQRSGNILKLLNTNQAGDNVGINWVLAGLKVNNVFNITGGQNVGSWKVTAVSYTLLELTKISGSSDEFSGDGLLTCSYTISGVLYTNQTNEGFSSITGVSNPDKYSNLMYSIGRNLQYWKPFMASAAKFLKGKDITTTMFKINDALKTQLLSETLPVEDKAPINEEGIRELKKVNPIIHKTTIVVDWDTALQLMDDIRIKKGFIRIQSFEGKIIKGYPTKIDYLWSTNEMKVELLEKYESDLLKIYKTHGTIFINEVGYDLKTGFYSYEMNFDYLMIRDGNKVLIVNPWFYKNIELEGVVYDDKIEFMDALNNLLP